MRSFLYNSFYNVHHLDEPLTKTSNQRAKRENGISADSRVRDSCFLIASEKEYKGRVDKAF